MEILLYFSIFFVVLFMNRKFYTFNFWPTTDHICALSNWPEKTVLKVAKKATGLRHYDVVHTFIIGRLSYRCLQVILVLLPAIISIYFWSCQHYHKLKLCLCKSEIEKKIDTLPIQFIAEESIPFVSVHIPSCTNTKVLSASSAGNHT